MLRAGHCGAWRVCAKARFLPHFIRLLCWCCSWRLPVALGAGMAAGLWGMVSPWLAPLGGVVVGGVLVLFRRVDGRFFAYYLMHDYAFSAQANGAYPAALEARLAVFKEAVAEGLQRDVDEVLVVGHSSGAYLAVSVLADVLRAGPACPRWPGAELSIFGAGGADGIVSAERGTVAR